MADGEPPHEGGERDSRIVRLSTAIEAIPDPVERAVECLRVGEQVRAIHSRLGEVRRRAVYEATLEPGATGKSVAQTMGVSTKAVSQATSAFRQSDLALLDDAIAALGRSLDPDDPDLVHLQAVSSSTKSITLLAQSLLRTYPKWIGSEAKPSLDEKGARCLDEAYERAEYICQLAQIPSTQQVRLPTLAFARPEYASTPDELIWPTMVLNAMPGILAWGTIYDYPDGDQWALAWSILPAERYTSVFDAGPDPNGWSVTEWLIWLARDFTRGGAAISSRVTAAPPFLNEPGEMLTFLIEGEIDHENSVSADEFAERLITTWDGNTPENRTGYLEIDWPKRPEVSV